ncbi:GNAT family N-acetyltransferase [Maritimibacter sp. UBA3975]|uniref:GNAT family N-acetyltransferase n=1 Tax=Maritimibacter sp. UBA3975 TaxID=1946833 RepID=UPI000C09787A|nr:GNAT family N-acetyltransferase [Maritimibacter sp. UBA3975]MAM62172.1 GNAT family N-acetyltransferase [Maritimibacter sp.]|tara:strand:- start:1953 stop:2450 length:498 start_codon:yes stop_codon:yes gene_type:complete
MTDATPYQFRPATCDDLPMLRHWLAAPHVARWWENADPFDAEDMADPHFRAWIVHHAGAPFAYVQDYAIHGWPDHPLTFLPEGSYGIDLFIGPEEMLGQGHGPAFVAQFSGGLIAQGAPAVGVDPDPANAGAIAAFGRAGFQPVGKAQDGPQGRYLPMVRLAGAG